MGQPYFCQNPGRREAVRNHATLNGIDYLEVLDHEAPVGSPRQRTLLVRCIKAIVPPLSASNVRLEGGVRVTPVQVRWAFPAPAIPPRLLNAAQEAFFAALDEADHVLVVRTNAAGDFSNYRLVLIASPTDANPPAGFDPRLSAIDFAFKVECPSDFDCKTELIWPSETPVQPDIDYLAKDYASFRRLMLDRLSLLIPDWREHNAADVQVALVELLAYVGDHLSYFQDAVATEAYLGTARKRISVRRHARLLDYTMHEGCNARAWVCFEVAPGGGADGLRIPAHTPLLTHGTGTTFTLDATTFTRLLPVEKPEVFETMHHGQLSSARNAIPFYTWTDTSCCLPRGSTQATLYNDPPLSLQSGEVLIFEEVLSPTSGTAADADPIHRHAVRLTGVTPSEDPLDGAPVVDIVWSEEDALPFPLCLSSVVEGQAVSDVSVARGNVVLVDHGRTIVEALEQVPSSGRFRPSLQQAPVTHRVPYDDQLAQAQPATTTIQQLLQQALPDADVQGEGETWRVRRDLLVSGRFAADFVLEIDDGQASLRFGDGILGKQPTPGSYLTARYRVGNGRGGNVGAEAINRIVLAADGITRLWNPLPATGGSDPEQVQQVHLYAPQAFRRQERAVTEADYAEVAQRHPGVQKAAATRRWTGSWYTMFVTIDRIGGRPVDADFEATMLAHLERYRMAGVDVEIDGPVFVPLDIVLRVCVQPGYFRSQVKQRLLEVFSNQDLRDGTRGFFHPDLFTFGQPLYVSQIYLAAMAVDGIAWVEVTTFQRWGKAPNLKPENGALVNQDIKNGALTADRLEVLRLDNDPNFPENGRIDFEMVGGL
jgi:Baseplate J-like protein